MARAGLPQAVLQRRCSVLALEGVGEVGPEPLRHAVPGRPAAARREPMGRGEFTVPGAFGFVGAFRTCILAPGCLSLLPVVARWSLYIAHR